MDAAPRVLRQLEAVAQLLPGPHVAKVCDDRALGFVILLTLNHRPWATWVFGLRASVKDLKMFEREERFRAMSRELNRVLAGKSALEKALLIAASLRRVYGGEWAINYEAGRYSIERPARWLVLGDEGRSG